MNNSVDGSLRLLSLITGMDEKTIQRGQQEIKQGLAEHPIAQIRLSGEGRLRVEKKDPTIVDALEKMIEPETAGSPMNAEKWVRSNLQHLSEKLRDQGHEVCPKTVGRLLKDLKYSLKTNVKRRAGSQHPDRNMQFEYIEAQEQLFLRQGWPIISLDGKKKELIGNFKNAGQSWCLEAEIVNDHDFETESQGRVTPYGVYNVNYNRGYVCVERSAGAAEFAVDILSSWWQQFGQVEFPNAPCLSALYDCGGSNGYRSRLWKAQLQEKLADTLGMTVMVCHYPTGASKWNSVEHRLFGPSASIGQPNHCVPLKPCWLASVEQPRKQDCRYLHFWSKKPTCAVSKLPMKLWKVYA